MLDRYALFLAVNLLFPNISLAESFDFLKLGDTANTNVEANSSDPVIWEPRVNGLSRFSLILPNDGIQDAIKYEDTSSLFYTSLTHDKGLKVTGSEKGNISLNISPYNFFLGYEENLTPSFSYLLGSIFDDSSIGPQVNLKYRTVSGYLTLHHYNAFFNEDDADIVWSRTALINDEKSELINTLGLGINGLNAGIGVRKFEVLGSNDAATVLLLRDDELIISSQIERYLGKGFGYLGLYTNIITGKLKFQIGLRINLDGIGNLHFSKMPTLENLMGYSLKGLRRTDLSKLWRNRVSIEGQ